MHSNKRVYLSGGMEYSADEGKDWRETLQQWLEEELHCQVFNPNRESDIFFRTHHDGVDFRKLKTENMQLYRSIAAGLVDLDCEEIAQNSDFVVCYWDESAMRGAGTKGELTIARYFGKPVYFVTTMPHSDIPGWVLGCVTRMFSSFKDLKTFLR